MGNVIAKNDSIELTWADLSSYVNKLILKRDGITLVELTNEDKKFVDITAIPGYKHTYALELYEDDVLKLTLEDLGSLQANGSISGYVFNNLADAEFTVPSAKVTASAIVNGVAIQLDTVTDENGFYTFEEVEYQGKKLGSCLLEYIIQEAFGRDVVRLWVHTCSLDHKYALNNYLSKGLKIFKEEEINFVL